MWVSWPKFALSTCQTPSPKYSVLLPPALKIVSLSTASSVDITAFNTLNCNHWFCLTFVLAFEDTLLTFIS